MYADPAVVRRKVERELKEYVERIDHYRARGIWVLEYFFPELLVAFIAANVKPFALVPYGVLLDLRNYDVEPPSVCFVNPFTRAPLKASEIPTRLTRLTRVSVAQPAVQNLGAAQSEVPGPQLQTPGVQPLRQDNLLQAWDDADERPFVCLQGVREYHDNPGHTGDSWWLHRAAGAGRIVRLLDLLSRYGTEQMVDVEYSLQFRAIRQQVTMEAP